MPVGEGKVQRAALGSTHAQTPGNPCSSERFVTSPDATTTPEQVNSPSLGEASLPCGRAHVQPVTVKGAGAPQRSAASTARALPAWGRHSTRTCPIPATAVSPVHIPHRRSSQEQATTLLCACTYSQHLPWQLKQATLYHFATLWKD